MLLARERFSPSVILLPRRPIWRTQRAPRGERVTTWHEERLLIDGELVPADGRRDLRDRRPGDRGGARRRRRRDGRRRPPGDRGGTARVRHTAPGHATTPSACAACASCTRRCSTTSTALREILVREVGAPVSSTSGPQLAGPTDVVSWYADLLEGYDFVEDLGERDTFAGRHHRWIEKEAAGVVGAITAYNYPIQLALAKLAPALAAGCTVVLKGAPDTPWATLALGKLIAEATDIPPGRRERAHVVRQCRRRRADHASRRRRRVVHRLDAGRASDHGCGERHREAGVPRARRQVGVRAARRRRRRDGGVVLLVRGDLALGSGLRDHLPSRRAARPLRRGRRPGARDARRCRATAIRPIRRT